MRHASEATSAFTVLLSSLAVADRPALGPKLPRSMGSPTLGVIRRYWLFFTQSRENTGLPLIGVTD